MTTYQLPNPHRVTPATAVDRAPTPSPRRPLARAGLLSTLTALVGALWLWRPAWSPLGDLESVPAAAVLDADRLPLLVLALGVLGATASAIGLGYLSRGRRAWPGWLGVVAVLLVLGSMSLLGVGSIMAAGYLVALLMPLGSAFVLTQLLRAGGVGRWLAVGALALVVGGGAASGLLTPGSITVFGDVAVLFGVELVAQAVPTLVILGALAWALVAVGTGRGTGGVDGLARWVLRHRTAITVVAASSALPYALVRLTWLTPWKLGASNLDQLSAAEHDEMILWGVMLSTGAWLGFVLTLGLIQRWGELFPRWLPGVAGRPVPVWVAAVPGGLVATILTASAVPMLMMGADVEWMSALAGAVLFPFWLWGPALALAVWGYVLHRQQEIEG